ncbi:MAG: NAD(P)/FAD-dependent oxidoreductase [Coriobacteriales bacterium]|nr:NAD(P)/FAD-dependent oxidoreductase [Coriobacteriales bacterium]
MSKKQRNASRSAQRASLLALAKSVRVPSQTDVCVVGGGAAGLVASIVAAEHGARVVVLEQAPECGRSILATGNGRCNFANRTLDPKLFNDPSFVRHACGTTWLDDVLDFFRNCGLAWAEEDGGRLYPLSRQASSVRNVLLARARAARVVLAAAREVTQLGRAGDLFEVTWHEMFGTQQYGSLRAQTLVVATGGLAELPLGDLGLTTTPISPILCPLACKGPLLDVLDGRRVRASATLLRNDHVVLKESGEVLFRPYGLSGIVVFNLSRHSLPDDKIVLDLMPTLPIQDALALASFALDGILDPVIAHALFSVTKDAREAVMLAKSLCYTVEGPAETSRAQVHRGGIVTNQLRPHNLEAKEIPRLFVCGEAVDVDGPCGGYNLAWAWKSGLVAGLAASEGLKS